MLLGGAAFLAGAVNAVAGGGALISFPALLAVGYPSIIANVTPPSPSCPDISAGRWAIAPGSPGRVGGSAGSQSSACSTRSRALLRMVSSRELFDRLLPFGRQRPDLRPFQRAAHVPRRLLKLACDELAAPDGTGRHRPARVAHLSLPHFLEVAQY